MTNKELEKKVDGLSDKFELLLDNLKQDGKTLNELIAMKEQPKELQRLEKGEWYFNNECGSKALICYHGNNSYGFGNRGEKWTDDYYADHTKAENYVKATTQEVGEAIKKETKNRLKARDTFKCLETGNIVTSTDGSFLYGSNSYCVSANNISAATGAVNSVFFKGGKWATIIENSFEIAGHKVEIDGENIKIGCQSFTKHSLGHLYDGCIACDIDSVLHREGGAPFVSMKELKELINYINK